MYRAGPAPTDQRPNVRPISFILSVAGQIRPPVTLPIRPEDLNRVESSRATVHQTLGRGEPGPIGWVDNFGEALPSVNISGHTGWRYADGVGLDGWGSFEALNQLVQHDYHEEKQAAIDAGRDPADVQLLFVDALDDFAWSVVPTQFVLRRSKSRPLLYQYQIALQAISTFVERPTVVTPNLGNSGLARSSLQSATGAIRDNIGGLVFPPGVLPPSWSSVIRDLVDLTTGIFDAVTSVITPIQNAATAATNEALALTRDMAQVGINLFRTVTAVANLPLDLRVRAARIAAAYNEVACIFANALRPRKPYEQYDGLYGASNCSSTTGGRPPSPYVNLNVFELMLPEKKPVTITSSALSSVSAMKTADPVLAPLPLQEVVRNARAIVEGVTL